MDLACDEIKILKNKACSFLTATKLIQSTFSIDLGSANGLYNQFQLKCLSLASFTEGHFDSLNIFPKNEYE